MSSLLKNGGQLAIRQDTRSMMNICRLPEVKVNRNYEICMESAFPALMTGEDDDYIVELLRDAKSHGRWTMLKRFSCEEDIFIGNKKANEAVLSLYRGKEIAKSRIYIRFDLFTITIFYDKIKIVNRYHNMPEDYIQSRLSKKGLERLDKLQSVLKAIVQLEEI